ncbi:small acid-soluble spore protein SspI [Mycoplasmatota bacterium]|nr:small acid-soluble spore protein SspI [Mycoplasmatota bacterium]
MNIDIRQAVIANLKGASHDDINKTILDALNSGEEKTLPGLGVLFELIWNSSSVEDKSRLIDNISTQI